MSPEFLHLSPFIFLLLSLSCLVMVTSHSSHSSLIIGTHGNSLKSPLDFLFTLNGTRKGNRAKGLEKLKQYLNSIGYVKAIGEIDESFDESLEAGIKKYQTFYKLNPTGVLDSNTINSLSRPRCGVADHSFDANQASNQNMIINASSSLFAFLGPVWPPGKRNLRYSFELGTRSDAYPPVRIALDRWSSVSQFKFELVPDFNSADVKITFDYHSFDGPGGVLANAAPPTNGNVRFDGQEDWSDNPNGNQFDIKTIALHEFGHILGLAHTQDQNAIMYAYFSPGQKKDLDSDDIQGIHTLYPN